MIRAPAGPTPGTARVREWPSGQRRQLWTAALKLGRSTKSKPGAIVCRGWLPGILVFHRSGRRPTRVALWCHTSVRDVLVSVVSTPAAGSIEVPTWAPVTPWPVAATSATALPARAAPVPIRHDPVAVGDALGLLKNRLAREVDAALAVDLGDLDVDLIADIDRVLHPLHPVLGQLADVDQAILVGHDLDESAEGHDAHHLALVVLANLDLAGQVANDLLRLGRRLAIHRADHDSTVILDVDAGHARVCDDLADHLAAGTDHFPDLVGMDLDGQHPRRVLRHRRTRLADRGIHLVHDEEAAVLRLLDGARHGVDADALDLHVHLHRGDAGPCAGHLEVHVTQGIFEALDVT